MTQDLASRLRTRLRQLREHAELSQEQLAVKAGLTSRTVRRIEQGGDTTIGSLQAIAAVLEVTVIDLLGNDEPVAS